MEFMSLEMLDRLSAVAILVAVALAVITNRLVWHTRLKAAEDRADKWETVALDALRTGAQAGVKAAEVTVDVVSAMPDPNRVRQGGGIL